MIRLFTTFFDTDEPVRRREFEACLRRNVACAALDEVIVLNEGGCIPVDLAESVTCLPISNRPAYGDFFRRINAVAKPADISIVANSDIFYDDSIRVLDHIVRPDSCLALSRWDVHENGGAELFDRNDSQDTWVFRGTVRNMNADFCLGVPRCDNRLIYELQEAGYRVLNPSFSVRSYHLHAGERVEYSTERLAWYVDPPYRYVWPHNLYGFARTLWHNLRHPDARLSWRFDRRAFNRWLPVRAVRKVGRGFTAWKSKAACC